MPVVIGVPAFSLFPKARQTKINPDPQHLWNCEYIVFLLYALYHTLQNNSLTYFNIPHTFIVASAWFPKD